MAHKPPLRVLLVHAPWGALERPSLGLSLLQAALHERGIDCQTSYLNLRLADRLGAELTHWITHELPHIAFAGDWLFTQALYGVDEARDAHYLDEVLRREWQRTEADIERLLQARSAIEPFMQEALAAHDWAACTVVGFTSTFEQNIAALALAQRIKALHPHVQIVFGGANWEGVMGQEYHRCFAFVDVVCSGEADVSFPALVEALGSLRTATATATSRAARLAAIPGIVYRTADGATAATGPAATVEDMDSLPVPSYAPYFEARDHSSAAQDVSPVLLFESSRGCWWGAKSHCTFCGLNGHSMGYRSKSGPRLLAELKHLIEHWPCPTLEAVDNILDMGYFDTVLPVLEHLDLPGPVFFEVKANLKRHHVAALKRAQITRIQPGIESLNDHVLALMKKGTTALRNVQLLKWCREYGVAVDWNLLHGFPGETDADYEAMMALLPLLTHLQAPGACGPIRLDRFSPYFERSASFGLHSVEPLPVYRSLYPVQGLDAAKVAYYFRFGYGADCQPSALAHEVVRLAESQRKASEAGRGGTLQALPRLDGGLQLHDTRPLAQARGQPATLQLSAVQRAIVLRIDEVASLAQVVHSLHMTFEGQQFDADNVAAFLDDLVARGMVLKEAGEAGDEAGEAAGRAADGNVKRQARAPQAPNPHYLGLALMPQRLRPTLEAASRRRLPRGVVPLKHADAGLPTQPDAAPNSTPETVHA